MDWKSASRWSLTNTNPPILFVTGRFLAICFNDYFSRLPPRFTLTYPKSILCLLVVGALRLIHKSYSRGHNQLPLSEKNSQGVTSYIYLRFKNNCVSPVILVE